MEFNARDLMAAIAANLPQVLRLGRYNPEQPRAPEGSPNGGQWVSDGGTGDAGLEGYLPIPKGARLKDDGHLGEYLPMDMGQDAPHPTSAQILAPKPDPAPGEKRQPTGVPSPEKAAWQAGKSIALQLERGPVTKRFWAKEGHDPDKARTGFERDVAGIRTYYKAEGWTERRGDGPADYSFERDGQFVHVTGGPTKAGEYELKVRAAAYNPDQPRAPKGDPEGGQWVDGGGSAGGTDEADTEQLDHMTATALLKKLNAGVPDAELAEVLRRHGVRGTVSDPAKYKAGLEAWVKKMDEAAGHTARLDDDKRPSRSAPVDPDRPAPASAAAKAGKSLANAASRKADASSTGAGYVEKKFTGSSLKGDSTSYQKESAAREEYNTAKSGLLAHYRAEGWTETEKAYEKSGYFGATFTKGDEKVKISGKPWKVGVERNPWGDSGGRFTYRLYIDHTKSKKRSLQEHEMSKDLRSLSTTTGRVRRDTLLGEPHLVVPVTALVEGVVFAHGATSPEYVPASSFGRVPKSWDVRPVMAGHPQEGGVMISAADPRVLDRGHIGWTFSSRMGSGKLEMEAWINERRAKLLGGDAADVVTRLAKGDTIEVSVGAHVDIDAAASGEYQGRAYRGAWKSVAPDHLAFLKAGDRGACSIEMGCGAQRYGAAVDDPDEEDDDYEDPDEDEQEEEEEEETPIGDEPEDRSALLLRAACDGKEHTPDGSAHTDGTPCACKGASTTTRKDTNMDDARIKALIASPRNHFTDKDAPFLHSLSAEQLAALEGSDKDAKPLTVEVAPPTPRTAEEFLATVPQGEMRDLFSDGLRTARARKDGQVAQLIALGAKRCPFTKEQLDGMSINELDRLVTLSGIEPPAPSTVDFAGRLPRALESDDSRENVYNNPPDPYAAPLKALQGGRSEEKAS